MKKIYILSVLTFFILSNLFGQVAGDFRSKLVVQEIGMISMPGKGMMEQVGWLLQPDSYQQPQVLPKLNSVMQ